MTHYYILNKKMAKGFEEITEDEYKRVVGFPPVRDYALKVYKGEITIGEVPEEHREEVAKIVEAKTARLGAYEGA